MHVHSGIPIKTWLADTGTKFLLLFIVLYAAYTLLSASHWAGVENPVLVTDWYSVCFSLATIFFTWRASTFTKLPRQIRRGWRLLTFGYIAFCLGDAIWF